MLAPMVSFEGQKLLNLTKQFIIFLIYVAVMPKNSWPKLKIFLYIFPLEIGNVFISLSFFNSLVESRILGRLFQSLKIQCALSPLGAQRPSLCSGPTAPAVQANRKHQPLAASCTTRACGLSPPKPSRFI